MTQTEMTYSKAMRELGEIESILTEGSVDLSQLELLVKRAQELLEYCQTKLRSTEEELDKLWQDQ